MPGATVQWVQLSINSGWTFSATIQEPFDLDAVGRFDTFTIYMADGQGGERTTPPLVIVTESENDTRNVAGAGLITITGEDLDSNKLRTPNQNFASFHATTSDALIETLASSVGVTAIDAPSQHITEEEVKGEKPAEAIARILQAYAYETVATASGLVFYAWEAASGAVDFDWSNRSRTGNKSQRYTGVRLGKTTSMPNSGSDQIYDFDMPGEAAQALTAPLMNPAADITGSLVGSIGAATFFNAAMEIVQHYYWAPDYATPIGTWGADPATSVHVVVLPGIGFESDLAVKARLRVVGDPYDELDPPPAGVDREFLYPPAGTSLGDWPYLENIVEPLWPGLAYAMERYDAILDRLNSAGDTMKLDGIYRCHSGINLRLRHTWGSRVYKCMSVRWEVSSATTTMEFARITV